MLNWAHVIDALPYVVVVMAFMLVRLIRVFTTHQQKMAEILNKTNSDQQEIAALRRDIADLKATLNDRVIANDDARQVSVPPPAPNIEERLRSNG